MLHRIKPVPRAILILTVVGGFAYAAMQIDLAANLSKLEAPQVVMPAQVEQASTTAPAQDTEAVKTEVPTGLIAAPQPNAGLDAVLNAGKK